MTSRKRASPAGGAFIERRASPPRGERGPAGERGPQGPQGEPGPAGELPTEQLQQLAALSRLVDNALKDLKIQFERIAQIQAQLDSLAATLKPPRTG